MIVAGGVEVDAEETITWTSDEAVVVAEDGSVTVLPPIPVGPVHNLEGSALGDQAYIVGTRCGSGQVVSDVGEVSCEPGDPVLLGLDLRTSTWSEIPLPEDAPMPSGLVGDQRVFALADGRTAYQVDIGDQRPLTFVTDDRGENWEAAAEMPGWGCVAQGILLAVDVGGSGQDGVTMVGDLEPTAELDLEISAYDPGSNSWESAPAAPDLAVVPGASSVECNPRYGVFDFELTGDRSGAIVNYSPRDGWTVVEDDNGSRFMGTMVSTDGLLFPQTGTSDILLLEGSLASANGDLERAGTTVSVPDGAMPLAGIGPYVLYEADGALVMQR